MEVKHSELVRSLLDEALGGQMQPVKEEIETCFPSVSEIGFYEDGKVISSFKVSRRFLDVQRAYPGLCIDIGENATVNFTEDGVKYSMSFSNGICYGRSFEMQYDEHADVVFFQTAIDYEGIERSDLILFPKYTSMSSKVNPLTFSDVKRVIGEFPYLLVRTDDNKYSVTSNSFGAID